MQAPHASEGITKLGQQLREAMHCQNLNAVMRLARHLTETGCRVEWMSLQPEIEVHPKLRYAAALYLGYATTVSGLAHPRRAPWRAHVGNEITTSDSSQDAAARGESRHDVPGRSEMVLVIIAPHLARLRTCSISRLSE